MPPKPSIDFRISSSKDFSVRKRSAGFLEFLAICATIAILGLGMSLSLYNKLAVLSALYTLGGFISLYVAVQMNRNHHLVQSTEFLNALFSSALSMNYKFAMIVNSDGKIVYFNRPFQDVFGAFIETHDRSFKHWLKSGNVSAEEMEKIMQAATKETGEKIITTLNGTLYSLTLEPIPRPSGFTLVRGRELTEAIH